MQWLICEYHITNFRDRQTVAYLKVQFHARDVELYMYNRMH